jgi:hypothetical protein
MLTVSDEEDDILGLALVGRLSDLPESLGDGSIIVCELGGVVS